MKDFMLRTMMKQNFHSQWCIDSENSLHNIENMGIVFPQKTTMQYVYIQVSTRERNEECQLIAMHEFGVSHTTFLRWAKNDRLTANRTL